MFSQTDSNDPRHPNFLRKDSFQGPCLPCSPSLHQLEFSLKDESSDTSSEEFSLPQIDNLGDASKGAFILSPEQKNNLGQDNWPQSIMPELLCESEPLYQAGAEELAEEIQLIRPFSADAAQDASLDGGNHIPDSSEEAHEFNSEEAEPLLQRNRLISPNREQQLIVRLDFGMQRKEENLYCPPSKNNGPPGGRHYFGTHCEDEEVGSSCSMEPVLRKIRTEEPSQVLLLDESEPQESGEEQNEGAEGRLATTKPKCQKRPKGRGFKRGNDLAYLRKGYDQIESLLIKVHSLSKRRGVDTQKKLRLWNQISSAKTRMKQREHKVVFNRQLRQKDLMMEAIIEAIESEADAGQAEAISQLIAQRWNQHEAELRQKGVPLDIHEGRIAIGEVLRPHNVIKSTVQPPEQAKFSFPFKTGAGIPLRSRIEEFRTSPEVEAYFLPNEEKSSLAEDEDQ